MYRARIGSFTHPCGTRQVSLQTKSEYSPFVHGSDVHFRLAICVFLFAIQLSASYALIDFCEKFDFIQILLKESSFLCLSRPAFKEKNYGIASDLTSRQRQQLQSLKEKGQYGFFKDGKLVVKPQSDRTTTPTTQTRRQLRSQKTRVSSVGGASRASLGADSTR